MTRGNFHISVGLLDSRDDNRLCVGMKMEINANGQNLVNEILTVA